MQFHAHTVAPVARRVYKSTKTNAAKKRRVLQPHQKQCEKRPATKKQTCNAGFLNGDGLPFPLASPGILHLASVSACSHCGIDTQLTHTHTQCAHEHVVVRASRLGEEEGGRLGQRLLLLLTLLLLLLLTLLLLLLLTLLLLPSLLLLKGLVLHCPGGRHGKIALLRCVK